MRLHSIVLGKIDEWNKYVYSLVDYWKGVCNKKDLFCYVTCSVLQTLVMETWVYGSLGSMHYNLKTRCWSVVMVKVNNYCGLIFILLKFIAWDGTVQVHKFSRNLGDIWKLYASEKLHETSFILDLQIFGDTVCNLITWLAWHPEYVLSCGTSICT